MRTVEVEIFNARLAVRETGNEGYLQALAAEVDARIQHNKTSSGKAGGLRDVNRSKRLLLHFQEPPKVATTVKPGAR